MYTINIEYKTGDSYHTETTEDTVGLEWENLEVAKVALLRIQEHYRWYNYKNSYYNRHSDIESIKRPEWHKTNQEEDEYIYESLINLPLDDGTEHQIDAFWCGHFEVLRAAEIIMVKPELNGMRVTDFY